MSDFMTNCRDKRYICGKEEKKQKILDIVKSHPEGVNAKYVSLESKLNHSTVRNYLRELVRDGKVYRPEKTHIYKSVANTTYGVAELKIQNVRLGFTVPTTIILTHEKIIETIADISLYIEFGETHQYVSATVGAEPPLTLREFKLLIKIFKDKVKERIGIEPTDKDIVVTSIELNQDYCGLRLDGINCVTLDGFYGFIEKIYNKKDCVRKEVKICQPISLESLYTLLTGGFKNFVLSDYVFNLGKKVERLEKDIGILNSTQSQLIQLQKALLEKFDKSSYTIVRTVAETAIPDAGMRVIVSNPASKENVPNVKDSDEK